jgi:hypothetical protein
LQFATISPARDSRVAALALALAIMRKALLARRFPISRKSFAHDRSARPLVGAARILRRK